MVFLLVDPVLGWTMIPPGWWTPHGLYNWQINLNERQNILRYESFFENYFYTHFIEPVDNSFTIFLCNLLAREICSHECCQLGITAKRDGVDDGGMVFPKSISSVGSVPKSSMAIIGRCASRFHAMKSAL